MNFCTYFDHNYLPRGLALYHSIATHLSSFRFFILCLSDEAKNALDELALPNIVCINLTELEDWDTELYAVKSSRSVIEYYFTLSPSLPLYIFNHYSGIDWLHYLDSDMYFFQSPTLIQSELEGSDCGITLHDFSERNKKLEWYGKYNVGLISWKNTENGHSILNWYRSKCIEWCYDKAEVDRFADQKYLDQFESLFKGVHVFKNKGINVAPWNVDNRNWSFSEESLFVDNVPLIFFHFHGVKEIEKGLFSSGFLNYGIALHPLFIKYLFIPYLTAYKKNYQMSKNLIKNVNLFGIRSQATPELINRLKVSGTCIEFSLEVDEGV
jgi:hypothetical protein